MDARSQYFLNRAHGLSPERVIRRLAYGSFVTQDRRLVYVETPKAACSTMKWVFSHLDGRQIRPVSIPRETSRSMCIHHRHISGVDSLASLNGSALQQILEDHEITRFCVVRNPYARLVSAWAHKIRQREPGYASVWDRVAAHFSTDRNDRPSFELFATWITETNTPRDANPHWQPMIYQLLPDLINYTHILKVESLTEGFDKVLSCIGFEGSAEELLKKYRTNDSLPIEWREFYTEQLASRVFEFYREDFEYFGYHADSWRSQQAAGNMHSRNQEQRLKEMESRAVDIITERNQVILDLSNKIRQLKSHKL